MIPLLIDCTGFAAVALNVSGLLNTSDRSLRASNGMAAALWALNNLFMGAEGAAALSALSVGRQASAAVVQGRDERTRRLACTAFLAITVLVSAVTWDGPSSILTAVASLLSTYAMFYLSGTVLRLAMVAVAGLWMYHAVHYHSFWQIAANILSAGAAAYGAWRTTRQT